MSERLEDQRDREGNAVGAVGASALAWVAAYLASRVALSIFTTAPNDAAASEELQDLTERASWSFLCAAVLWESLIYRPYGTLNVGSLGASAGMLTARVVRMTLISSLFHMSAFGTWAETRDQMNGPLGVLLVAASTAWICVESWSSECFRKRVESPPERITTVPVHTRSAPTGVEEAGSTSRRGIKPMLKSFVQTLLNVRDMFSWFGVVVVAWIAGNAAVAGFPAARMKGEPEYQQLRELIRGAKDSLFYASAFWYALEDELRPLSPLRSATDLGRWFARVGRIVLITALVHLSFFGPLEEAGSELVGPLGAFWLMATFVVVSFLTLRANRRATRKDRQRDTPREPATDP